MPTYSSSVFAVKHCLLASIAVAAFISGASAQQPRAMLGHSTQMPDKFSKQYNIRFNDAGFDVPHSKTQAKSYNYILKHGGTEYLANSFMDMANELTATPDWFANAIDGAWERRTAAFRACGGQWAAAANNTSPSSVYVIVQPTLWQASAYGQTYWVNGEMIPGNGQYVIRAVNLYTDGILSTPSQAYLVDFASLVEWEMGNALAAAAGYQPSGVDQEIGNKCPCAGH